MPDSTPPARRPAKQAGPQQPVAPPAGGDDVTLDRPPPAKPAKAARPKVPQGHTPDVALDTPTVDLTPPPPQPQAEAPPAQATAVKPSAKGASTLKTPHSPGAKPKPPAPKTPAALDEPATLEAPPPAAAKLPNTLTRGPRTTGNAPPAEVVEDAAAWAKRDFGDYVLLEEVARGGMGVVYRARQKSLNRVVALKLILAGQLASADQVRRFRVEAEEAGQLDHPNIVPIYQVGEHAGHHYFSMKLIEGGSLSHAAKRLRNKPKAVARVVSLVARAVHYAHQHGILHRDLKPGNILLDDKGEPHVTDFGLAKHIGGDGGQTQSGAIVGTPSYMAPEQAAGSKNQTTAVDVYGLGAVLYDLLTGKPPFVADSVVDILHKVMDEDPVPPHSVSDKIDRDLETICLTCLAKEPAARYASAEALADDLDRYLAGDTIQARPAGRMERLARWVRRRPAWAALIAVSAAAAVLLLVGGWVSFGIVQGALKDAQSQRDIAEGSAEDARRQRDQVAAHFAKRLDLVDDMVLKIDGRLARMDGMESLRVEFMHELLNLSTDLLAERPGDPVVRKQAARVYVALGSVLAENQQIDDAAEAYGKGLELLTGLAQERPQDYAVRSEAASIHALRGGMLAEAGEPAEARRAFQEAVAMEDRLAQDFPDQPMARVNAARAVFQLANLDDAAKKVKEAREGYLQALDRQEQLLAEFPDMPPVLADLARTCEGLAFLLEASDKGQARTWLERAHRHWREAAPHEEEFADGLDSSYRSCRLFYERHGLHAELARLGEELSQDGAEEDGYTSTALYNAACYAAMAAGLVRSHPAVPEADRARLAESYGSRAVKLFEKAMQAGFDDRALIDTDPDLHPLRQRDDFKVVMAEVEKRLGARPATPRQELDDVRDDYNQRDEHYRASWAAARTEVEKKKALAEKPALEPAVRRVLELAAKSPESEAAVDALGWALDRTAPDERGKSSAATEKLRGEVLAALEKDHLTKAGMSGVCARLVKGSAAADERLLVPLCEKHPQAEVRGLAAYCLARSLEQQWRWARARGDKGADELSRRAEEQYEKVIKDWREVPYNKTTLGAAAEAALYQFRHLSVGRQALEIDGEDVAGQRMTLSEHRGKVVVLSFWAHWCGFCRQLYPHERQMVARYQGRPFVLLGVNCEDDRPATARVQQREAMTWKSWWAPSGAKGDIGDEWRVSSFPTIYVIDHKGVIRHKNLRGPQLDEAVEALIREAENEKAGGRP